MSVLNIAKSFNDNIGIRLEYTHEFIRGMNGLSLNESTRSNRFLLGLTPPGSVLSIWIKVLLDLAFCIKYLRPVILKMPPLVIFLLFQRFIYGWALVRVDPTTNIFLLSSNAVNNTNGIHLLCGWFLRRSFKSVTPGIPPII
jgi:hypothetical protein